mgnify:CR=1 FL=1
MKIFEKIFMVEYDRKKSTNYTGGICDDCNDL